jgi:hypothetical protein
MTNPLYHPKGVMDGFDEPLEKIHSGFHLLFVGEKKVDETTTIEQIEANLSVEYIPSSQVRPIQLSCIMRL